MKKVFDRIYVALILLFMYVPIFVMIVFSFNDSKSRSVWQGFSLRWYEALFNDQSIMDALWLSLLVAVLSAAFSTVLGTLAAIGLRSFSKRTQNLVIKICWWLCCPRRSPPYWARWQP